MQNAARRRSAFPSLAGWGKSRKGNAYIKLRGYVITIFEKDDGFGASIQNDRLAIKRFARRTYPTVVAAKLAAFDRMTFYETH